MVYGNNLAAAIRVNGEILREQNGTVFLPFGSEYSIRLKNLNTKKCSVRIEIDGEDVLNGNSIIVEPNRPFDLERWICKNDLQKGPRFKFIERTDQISEYRGNRVDDGIIRIEYQFVEEIIWVNSIKPSIIREEHHHHHYDYFPVYPYHPYTPPYPVYPFVTYCSSTSGSAGVTNCNLETVTTCDASSVKLNSVDVFANQNVKALNDNGITIKGSESNQTFNTVKNITLEPTKHSLCIMLRGKVGEKQVETPIHVKTKLKCDVCGKANESSNKFCGQCGNNLIW